MATVLLTVPQLEEVMPEYLRSVDEDIRLNKIDCHITPYITPYITHCFLIEMHKE